MLSIFVSLMYCPLPVAPHLLKFKGCVIVGVDFSIQQVSISLTLNAITRFIIHITAGGSLMLQPCVHTLYQMT